MDVAFKLYKMECQGKLNTYQSYINAAVNYMFDHHLELNDDNIECAWEEVGGDIFDLDDEAMNIIADEVFNRRGKVRG